jgi:hypothetical protein
MLMTPPAPGEAEEVPTPPVPPEMTTPPPVAPATVVVPAPPDPPWKLMVPPAPAAAAVATPPVPEVNVRLTPAVAEAAVEGMMVWVVRLSKVRLEAMRPPMVTAPVVVLKTPVPVLKSKEVVPVAVWT